ncbi:MAG TPA: phosphatidate cytidylyltransferase, partial [Phaeodactylibacter sp.]|nr:phosphatidate cytidylyltransferase [Phaeodactylibacter sp.]
LWEYFTLTFKSESNAFLRKMVGIGLGITPFLMATTFHLGNIEMPVSFFKKCLLILLALLFLIFIFELFTNSKKPFSNIGNIFLGFFYIGASFALIQFIAINNGVFYPKIILGLLLLTWANDTGAYVIGSQVGKTPLFPRISPNKTWEGSLGGVVVTFVIAWLLGVYVKKLSTTDWLVLAGLVSVFGSIGDLIESMLKRSLGVKDSGNIMPGHGGFLDRFDAFMFLLPFAAVYLLWIR